MRLALMLLLCLLTSPAWAAQTYHVAKDGNNSRTCEQARSQATPRLTIQQGIACLAGGDTLILGDGVFHEQIADTAGEEQPGAIRPPAGLSWNQPTTIKAAHPRKAILDKPQPGHPYNHTVYLGRADTRYLVLEGLVIDGRGHGTCVWVGPASSIRLKGTLIRNCGSHGIYGAVADDGSGGQDIQLLDNEIVNVAAEQGGQPPGSHAIYFTGNNSIARGNAIHAPCPFYGLHYTSEHGGVHSNVIENNRVVGCDQAGIYSQGASTVVRNNLLENNCIGVYLSSAPTAVLNNTIFGTHTASNCSDAYGIFDKSGGSTVANNLILQQHTAIYSMKTPPTMASNLCDGPGCQLQVASYASVVVDGPGGNLTLVPGGPAANAGTPLAQVPTDRLGVTRPQGSGVDIGAYEYTTQAPPIDPPPSGADTTKPQVTLTSPVAGPVSGVVTLDATATDNVGVVGLQYHLDGTHLGGEQSQAPYQQAWDTATATPGPHTLSVSVRDASGNFGQSAPVSVTVVATTPAPPAGTPLACVGIQAPSGVMAIACTPAGGRR